MNRKSKWLVMLIGLMLLSTIMMACGNGNDGNANANGGNDAGSPNNTEDKELTVVDGKIEPTVTIKTIMYDNPAIFYKEGESTTDNVFTRWIEEELGVKFEALWTAGIADGTMDTKLQLMLSSGDELPDVVHLQSQAAVNLLMDSGLFMEVGPIFDEYASPAYKAAMEAKQDAWLPFIRDGKRMAIPSTADNVNDVQNVLWIRQDWLDALNLEAPKTIEELEAVMDAFVNQDPDGNGQKDTYALDFAMKDALTGSTLGDVSWVFGLYGAVPERWYPGEDGQLVYGSTQPGIKQGLAKLNEWKDKGYIASDIALHDANSIVASVSAGKVGMVAAPNYFMLYPGSLLLATEPTAMYTPYPLPEGVDGQNMRAAFNTSGGATLISKDISEEALQAYFHVMNHMYGLFDANDPFYFRGFQEGYDYVIQDGEFVTDPEQIPGGKAETFNYVFLGMPNHADIYEEIVLKIANQEELTEQDEALMFSMGVKVIANPLDRIMYDAILVAREQVPANVRNYYQGPTTSTMSSRNELLNKMQMETFAQIIYGELGIDAFDEFVERWKASGGDKITEEVNEWYDSVR